MDITRMKSLAGIGQVSETQSTPEQTVAEIVNMIHALDGKIQESANHLGIGADHVYEMHNYFDRLAEDFEELVAPDASDM